MGHYESWAQPNGLLPNEAAFIIRPLERERWMKAEERTGISNYFVISNCFLQDFRGRVKGLKLKVVDATGARDAFVAGILSLLAKDLSLLQDEGRSREALRFATACGALTVMERGVIPALPTKDTVENELHKTVL